MANRLSKITTRTGDDGTTGLGDGSRVEKYHPRVEVMGEVDELNSAVGAILSENISGPVRELLIAVQHDLFDLGGELSVPGRAVIGEIQLGRLDELILALSDSLPPLREFILPGGTRAASCTHMARTVCRRAERRLVQLASREAVNGVAQKYLNRLSDVFFQLSRVINRDAGIADVYWQPKKDPYNSH